MPNPAFIEGKRAERRATIGQRPMVLGRHGQSAGTARVRPQFTKPAAHWRVPSTGRHSSALAPVGAEPGHKASSGRLVPGEGLGGLAQRGLQGRQTYSFDKGLQ